ncbi:MAG TPA: tetratricopeptide repeat protein [Candidatus Sulfotelmatobacter sp.]|nr:tetratricopeptide repeat protein [Candidatus Sulfotelmatobacter sp.]
MKRIAALSLRLVGALALLLAGAPLRAQTNSSLSGADQPAALNAQEIQRAYLELQAQVHATQLTLEQSRKDADQAAVQTARLLSERLQAIENTLTVQRTRELEGQQSSQRVLLLSLGTLAGIGCMALALLAYFQWRAIHRLAEISRALRPLPSGAAVAALPPSETALVTLGPVESANARLLGALEQLEKRLGELEIAAKPALQATALVNGTPATHPAQPNGNASSEEVPDMLPNGTPADPPPTPSAPSAEELLSKGQSLLDLDNTEAALACFEAVLKQTPHHTEALVKRGTALERLRRYAEALACYDLALAADSSMTIAYLYKGGLLNRLERFAEALDCYDKALHTQEKLGN